MSLLVLFASLSGAAKSFEQSNDRFAAAIISIEHFLSSSSENGCEWWTIWDFDWFPLPKETPELFPVVWPAGKEVEEEEEEQEEEEEEEDDEEEEQEEGGGIEGVSCRCEGL